MFKLNPSDLIKYFQIRMPEEDCNLEFWDGLIESFGLLLPFLLSPEALCRLPYKVLGIPFIDVRNITPAPNEAWVLFRFHAEVVPGSPLRRDGFLLICEWRKSAGHSPRLPESLHLLADRICRQLNVDGWSIHPSYPRYGDKIDFSDETLFASRENDNLIASAWSALATGLYFAVNASIPGVWPFSSIQFNFSTNRLEPVEGVEEKMQIAEFFRAREFRVAASQLPEAQKKAGTRLRVIGINSYRSVTQTISEIAVGSMRRRRKRMLRMGVCFAALGVAILCGGGGYLAYCHPVHSYYQGFSYHREQLIRGIGPLSAKQARARVNNYRFTYRGYWGKLAEVALTDGLTRPAFSGSIDPLLSETLPRGEKLHLHRTVRIQLDGDTIAGYNMFGGKTYYVTWVDIDGAREMRFGNRNGGNLVSGGVSFLKMTFAKNGGDMQSIRYFDNRNRPTRDINGVHGFDVTESTRRVDPISGRDSSDAEAWEMRSITQSFVDVQGRPTRCQDGYHKVELLFDTIFPCLPSFIFFRDAGDRPIVNSQGIAGAALSYDWPGNLVELRHLDAQFRPADTPQLPLQFNFQYDIPNGFYSFTAIHRQRPLPRVSVRLDSHGLKIEEKAQHLAGKANWTLNTPQGSSYGKTYAYDDQGRKVTTLLLSDSTSPSIGWVDEYNREGQLIRSTVCDATGKPVERPDGVTTITRDYRYVDDDSDDRLMTLKRWKADGTAFDLPLQRHCEVWRNDKYGNTREISFFDASGNRACAAENGLYFHRRIFCYHNRTISGIINYDADGNLAAGPMAPEVRREFNEQNYLTREAFYRGEKLVADPLSGVAETRCTYHERSGMVQEIRSYDSNRHLVRNCYGYAVKKFVPDENGFPAEQYMLDENEQPVNDNSGRHRYSVSYDYASRAYRTLAYDVAGNPVLPLVQVAMLDGVLKSGDIVLKIGKWSYQRHSEETIWPYVSGELVDAEVQVARREAGAWRLKNVTFSGFLPLIEWFAEASEEKRVTSLIPERGRQANPAARMAIKKQ